MHDVKSPLLSLEESYTIKRCLRTMNHLKTLLLWKVCDDATLYLIGSHCPQLELLGRWPIIRIRNIYVYFHFYLIIHRLIWRRSIWSTNIIAFLAIRSNPYLFQLSISNILISDLDQKYGHSRIYHT